MDLCPIHGHLLQDGMGFPHPISLPKMALDLDLVFRSVTPKAENQVRSGSLPLRFRRMLTRVYSVFLSTITHSPPRNAPDHSAQTNQRHRRHRCKNTPVSAEHVGPVLQPAALSAKKVWSMPGCTSLCVTFPTYKTYIERRLISTLKCVTLCT